MASFTTFIVIVVLLLIIGLLLYFAFAKGKSTTTTSSSNASGSASEPKKSCNSGACALAKQQQPPQPQHAPGVAIDRHADINVIFYHWESCGPCRMFRPEWEKLKQTFAGDARVSFEEYEMNHPRCQSAIVDGEKVTRFPTVSYAARSAPGTSEKRLRSAGENAEQLALIIRTQKLL